eukprot:COSAG06_NODE_12235_length_1405_cov_165.610260_2_plen_79_part_00
MAGAAAAGVFPRGGGGDFVVWRAAEFLRRRAQQAGRLAEGKSFCLSIYLFFPGYVHLYLFASVLTVCVCLCLSASVRV